MIEAYCEGQGSLKLRPESHVRGNYISKLYFSGGDGELKSVLARDLLRVGQAAFLTDRAFRRGQRLGQQTRNLSVCLPVEEPERWTSIRNHVTNLAEFVSQDQWHFEFKHLRKRRHNGGPAEDTIPNPSINLFSDGLDSLCGAAAAFQRGETPIFVTHSPPGRENVKRKVEALQASLGFRHVEPQFINVYFRTSDRDARGKRNMFPEGTRRTRPMLFLSMAGAAALELRVAKIYLNGLCLKTKGAN